MNALWSDLASRAALTLSDAQHALLTRYLDALFVANERMNLTRIPDRAQAELHHIADSLTLLPYLNADAMKIADAGSGGGVPGIPLAILRPDAQFLLIESTKKKAAFLRGVIAELQLPNVQVSDQRLEEIAHDPAHREQYDIVTARAVATMPWLIEWCVPLLKKTGKLLAQKGPKVHEELPLSVKALKLTGGGAPVIHPVALPGIENHLIVEISKDRKSDSRYPRPAPQAKGKPLS